MQRGGGGKHETAIITGSKVVPAFASQGGRAAAGSEATRGTCVPPNTVNTHGYLQDRTSCNAATRALFAGRLSLALRWTDDRINRLARVVRNFLSNGACDHAVR